MTPRHVDPRACGFTLIELIASIVILAVIGTVAASPILQSLDSYADASTAAQLQSEASAAMERIAGAIAAIGLDPNYAGNAPHLTNITPTSVSWHDSQHRVCQVSRSGSQLQFVESAAPAVTLMNDVTAFQVQAYDASNAALGANLNAAQCVPVRRIKLDLTALRGGRSQSLRTKVFIRSLMAEGT